MDARVILLFGMPRSGTTWLGKIFDSHPETLYRHEPDSVNRLAALPLLPETSDEGDLEYLRQYSAAIPSVRALKVVGKSPVFRKSYFRDSDLLQYRIGIAVSRLAARAGSTLPVMGVPIGSASEARLVWKSIESLGRLGVLLEALPEARSLQIVRHPCGYVASVERGESGSRFGDLVRASEDYELLDMLLRTKVGQSWGLSVADLREMYPEERLAWRWAVFNDKALSETEGNEKALAFAYERLCDSPVSVAKDLLAHASLAWDPQVEEFIRASTEHGDTSYYSVYKNPAISARSWQTSLEPARAERIHAVASRSRVWRTLDFDRLSQAE